MERILIITNDIRHASFIVDYIINRDSGPILKAKAEEIAPGSYDVETEDAYIMIRTGKVNDCNIDRCLDLTEGKSKAKNSTDRGGIIWS